MYFNPWVQNGLADCMVNVDNIYRQLMDNSSSTCHDISDADFINVIWVLPYTNTTSHFRLYMKGSQQCQDVNAVWFLGSGKYGSSTVQCNVTQKNDADLQVCDIQCVCPCEVQCNYLYLSIQFPPWIKKTLSLCLYEQLVWD